MSNRKRKLAATIEDCVSVLLGRGADLLESAGGTKNVDAAILFNLKVWAAIRGLTAGLDGTTPWANTLISYADFATSGMMSRQDGSGEGLGALAHLDRHAAQFVLSGGDLGGARERVVRLFGEARVPAPTTFDDWLLDEVRSAKAHRPVTH